jgi:hypothetical protein
MRGNTRQVRVLAAALLLLVAVTSVEGHGRHLQAQQALHLPHGFNIPNIFNTCEWVGLAAAMVVMQAVAVLQLSHSTMI